MRYIIQAMTIASLLLGVTALVTHEVDAQDQPEPFAAMRCNPHENPNCPDWDGRELGGRSNVQEQKRIVVYDGSPKQRPGEDYSRYQDRRYFVEHFERFVEQSKVSEEQVRQILLALYDYQEQESALLKATDETMKSYDGSLCPDRKNGSGELGREHFRSLRNRLHSILTQKQMYVWDQTCVSCYHRVGWYHDDHILKLEEK